MNVLIVSVSKKSAQLLSKTIQRLSQQPDNIDIVVGRDDFLNYLNNNEDPELIFNVCGDEVEDLFSIYSKKQVSSALVFFARNDRHMASSFLFNTLYFYTAEASIEDVKFCFDKYSTYFKEKSEVSYVKDLQKLTHLLAEKDKEYKKRFMVKIGNVIRSVNVQDIAYFFSHERINYLVKFNGKKFPIDNSLDEVEELLDPEVFFRANRQFIINIDSIAEIHPYFKGRVKLNLEPNQASELVISAEKSRSFKDWLDE
jgi:DNA-binding LytR/AlgR family response regulator|tara:strand:+ start:2910 stop:3677 length:768 start_codon:yes stop_codon:yes gene_type:complete